ncbi:MAG TPA: antibiotic biosynthesis monooxygenase [Puia sp.]|jgi:quinol monooxygenase YgiN
MKKVLVRYKLHPERVADNEALVREVYRQLHEQRPDGIRYATYKLPDGVSFVHIGSYQTEAAHKAFTSLSAFRNFQAGIKDRCEELPAVNAVEEIGFYA